VAEGAEHAVKLGVAAEAGGQRGLEQVPPPLVHQRGEPVQAHAVLVLHHRHPDLHLEDVGQAPQADVEARRDLRAAEARIAGQDLGRRRRQPARRRRLVGGGGAAVRLRAPHRVQHGAEERAEDGGLRLPGRVDGRPAGPGVVEQHADPRVGRQDRRPGHPAPPAHQRLGPLVLEDRAVVEDREVLAVFLGPPEGLAIEIAHRVHDLVLVDEAAAKVGSPGPEHQVPRLVVEEDPHAREADARARQLDRAADDGVRILEPPDLVEGGEQRRHAARNRRTQDLGRRLLGPEDD